MTATGREAFDAVCDGQLIRHPEDVAGTMFGCPGLRYGGGPFYTFAKTDRETGRVSVAVKLPAGRVQEILAAGAGVPCAPHPDRPMREWVFLTDADEESLGACVEEARAFLATLS